jgi:hypothetical protein
VIILLCFKNEFSIFFYGLEFENHNQFELVLICFTYIVGFIRQNRFIGLRSHPDDKNSSLKVYGIESGRRGRRDQQPRGRGVLEQGSLHSKRRNPER